MRTRLVLIGGLGTLAVAVVAVWFVFFSDSAPDAVTNAAANEQLDQDLADATEGTVPEDTAPEDTAPEVEVFDGDINGTWMVDNTIGTFEFESASGSFAGFRVEEELTVGSATAVGRTGAVTGSITIDDGSLTAADLVVDLTAISSNDARRENAIQRALDTGDFPETTFGLTAPLSLPDGLAAGDVVEAEATGDLTIHGVTTTATFALTANVRDDGIAVVTGSSPVVFADYGVSAPSAPIVVSVADNGIIEFQLLLTQTA
jgi:polyisoprenoid-binding protein YceI